MSEQKDETPQIKWFTSSDGVKDVYSNLVHLNWTLHDVRIRFGQVVPNPDDPPEKAGWAVMESAAVTIPWGQAKVLRDILVQVVQKYEAVNGEITVPQLPT